MRVVIVGGGEAGYHVAKSLSEKNDVVVIEKQSDACERLDMLDVQVMHRNGADIRVLKEAGVRKADLVVAMTGVDEINILVCMGAKLISKGVKTIARVSNPDYIDKPVDHREELGMDALICPELSLAREIAQVVSIPSALDVGDFVDGKVKMMEFVVKEDHEIAGKRLRDADLPDNCIITGIFRGRKLLIPHGDDVVQLGDRVVLVGRSEMIDVLQASVGLGWRGREQKILIVGGGDVGFYLLKELTKASYDITIMDRNKDRCAMLAECFPGVLVIHGDGTDLQLLEEEDLLKKDVVVSVTDRDETNLLSSLLAKELGVGKVISRTEHTEYAPLFEMVGVDVAINPILATVNEVMKFTMQVGISSIINLEGEKANLIEITARKGSKVIDKPLEDIRFPKDAIVCVIVKGSRVIVPSGKDTIEAGDKVVIFSLPGAVGAVEKLFK